MLKESGLKIMKIPQMLPSHFQHQYWQDLCKWLWCLRQSEALKDFTDMSRFCGFFHGDWGIYSPI